jgi:hypothetical protein
LTTTDVVPADDSGDVDQYSELSYSELLGLESYRVTGFALLDKRELLGVPHIITRVTYWRPNKNKDGSLQLGMVSVEAILGDIDTLLMAINRRWVPNVDDMTQLKLQPNERIVYNDGSTGIRRQLTQLFHKIKLINVGSMTAEEEKSGAAFDRAWPDWESFSQFRRQSEEVGDVPSIGLDHRGRPLVIRADRGLSVSEYSNSYTDEGETFYLR